MGTAVDIRARQPFSAPNDVVGYQQDDTLVQLIARQPFNAPNDLTAYPVWPYALPSFSEDVDPVSGIVSIATLGQGSDAASSTSYTFTTATTALAAGDFGILMSVADNISASDGDNSEHTVSGGTGSWSKLGEYTNSGGGAALGVTTSVWVFHSTGSNPIGTAFNISFTSAVVEKASTMWAYSKTPGTSIILDPAASPNPVSNEVNGAVDFGSASFSGLSATRQRLYFRGLGKEANSATLLTATTNFTRTGQSRSQNAASAVLVRGEFRINSSSGETSNPTLSVSGDTAGVFLALIETVAGTVSKTLGALTTTGAGVVPVNGVVNVTLGDLTLTGAGTVASSAVSIGTLDVTLGALTLTGVADIAATGAGSVFFWGPEMEDGGIATDSADLELIELLTPAMIDIDYTGETTIAPTGTGRTFATTTMRGVQVHIQIDIGNDITVAESLMAMVSFAKRGGIVGFALDRSYAFFAQMSGTVPTRGDTTFDYGTNALSSWGGDSPSAGWRLYLASPLPQMRREIVQVASRLGTTITTVDPIVFTLDAEDGVTIVRHKYFFPFLRYISGDVVVSEPQGSVYRFDALFEEDVGQEQLFLNTAASMHQGFGDMTLTAQGTVGVQGQVNDTFGPITSTAFGTTQGGSAYFNQTLGALTLTGAGTAVGGQASLNKTFATMTVTGAGHSSEQGTYNAPFGSLTVTSVGTVN